MGVGRPIVVAQGTKQRVYTAEVGWTGYRDGRLLALRHGSHASARSADPFIEVVQEADGQYTRRYSTAVYS